MSLLNLRKDFYFNEKNLLKSLTLVASLFTFACGRETGDLGSEAPKGTLTSSVIIGQLDWQDITTLPDRASERINSSSVADVSIPARGSRCTGFLINEDTLMTNHHCVPFPSASEGLSITLQNESGIPTQQRERFDCSTFIGHNFELDFALLKCSGLPGLKYGSLKLDQRQKSIGSSMYLIQQNCDYFRSPGCNWSKKIAFGSFTSFNQTEVSHNADSLGGSSGSPLFSRSNHAVVAIHNAGLPFCQGCREGSENFGKSMGAIVPYIQRNFPEVILNLVGGNTNPTPSPLPAPSPDPLPTPIQTPTPTPPAGNPGDGNDTYPTASPIERFTIIERSIASADDVDIYELQIDYQNKLLFYLDILESNQDLDLYVISADSQILGRSEDSITLEFLDLSLKPGTYFIVVQGHDGAKGDYRLSVY